MFLLNVLLALAWVALTGEFTPVNLAIGFVVVYVLLRITQRTASELRYLMRVRQALGFAIFYVWELILASLRVAVSVLSPLAHLQPAVVAVPLDLRTNGAVTLLANLITLTPGTLTLDVAVDEATGAYVLYVHTMDVGPGPEVFRRNIKRGYEQRIMELMA